MSAHVSYNEPSWAIDLIAHIKRRVTGSSRAIKGAGGEQTVRTEGGSLFPDVLLFGDQSAALILQGWELKMPDTDIDSRELFQNAAKKAQALGLDSFVLWNVTCARLYIRNVVSGQFERAKQWPTLDHIADRPSVLRFRNTWEALADRILSDLNNLFEDGTIEGRPFVDAYRSGGIQNLVLANTVAAAEALNDAAMRDQSLRAEITLWWERYGQEYQRGPRSRYEVLARANLLNWIGKLLFVHVLLSHDDTAHIEFQLSHDASPTDALEEFSRLSDRFNFWTIFAGGLGMGIVPKQSWAQLKQLNKLLTDLRIASIDQTQLAIVLEAGVETVYRKVRGQFATPPALAQLVAALALRNIKEDKLLDPCCGSGTIARAALDRKLNSGVPPNLAAAAIFAGDLDSQATQLTTLAMVKPNLLGIPLRIYCQDAFSIHPEFGIDFHDPSDGSCFTEKLGTFDSIASNLPFVSQVGRKHYKEGIDAVTALLGSELDPLPARLDIAAYLPFALHPLLESYGRMVVIMSNAWLSTEWGDAFYNHVLRLYSIKSIVISGSGRWFQNSKVVTTLVVLERRGAVDKLDEEIDFVVLNRPLGEYAESQDAIDLACAQIESGRVHGDTLSLRSVKRSDLDLSRELGLGRNAQFVNCGWTRELPLIPIRELCNISRGERRGWDKLFYPTRDHGIEQEYVYPILKSPSTITRYLATADQEAFCCSASIKELRELQHDGALRWIRQFQKETNKVGKPLPEVLARSSMLWYEMHPRTTAELVIPINFGERLFVARMDPPAFANQRVTILNSLPDVDISLLWALILPYS